MTPCERIDSILKSRNMSRRKLAIKAGIAPSSFQSAMERNGHLSLDMLFPISDVLGVPVQFLDIGEEEEYPDLATLDEEYERLSPDMKISFMLWELNPLGQQKAVERVEELTEIPRYRRQEAPQPTLNSNEGKDATPPPEGSGGPQEGE